MMAAISAADVGADVTLLEKNEKLGKKMYITGKGRCNLTNACSPRDFLSEVVTNPRFLFGALNRFSPQSTMEFCVKRGLALKIERGNRVFPMSDKSSDVISVFAKCACEKAEVRLNCEVFFVEKSDGLFLLRTSLGTMTFDRVVVATGGASYKATGSTGFGYKVAESFGLKVSELRPALCRIRCLGTEKLEGLSLKNVKVGYRDGVKDIAEFGEMLFTDDGVSGPAALTLSSKINKFAQNGAWIYVDLKPALGFATLDARILRDFSARLNKDFANSLDALLPERLIGEVVRQSGIPACKKVNQITAAERHKLAETLKNLSFPFVALDEIERGIVTSGGVDVLQINPASMECKSVKGLCFAGEVLDVDALTGGFNMQIAFSTGFVAGTSCKD